MSRPGIFRWNRIFFGALFLWVSTLLLVPHASAEEFLEPGQAFGFSARMLDAGTAEVSFRIADGYYMYRERFAFAAESAQVGAADIPRGKVKFDETFQKEVETYRGNLSIRLPVQASGPFTLRVTSQGCSDKGLCYAPMESSARLDPVVLGGGGPTQPGGVPDTDTGRIEASLASGSLFVIMPLFLLLGLGLSLTPCVLPMVPILSSIIVGEGAQASRGRGLALSVSYSLGMAVVYTALGVAAGLAGEGLAATLQNPWALGIFAALMVALSLSMFGLYPLQVPPALQAKLTGVSNRQSAGKMAGVFSMGAISALIVGPCVAAPLAASLMYISQTRDVLIGAAALFSMAVGMSVPLLLLGVSAGTLLPRAGAWMDAVKIFFGVLMLALAVWIVSPVLPGWMTMAGWGSLGLGYGVYLLRGKWSWLSKAGALVFLAFGGIQLVGLASGGSDALAPLAHLSGGVHKTEFRRVRSPAELDAVLATANGRPVMLDFYADWCVSCIEMEKFTFSAPHIRTEFEHMILLQADVTANNADDKALLKRFNLFGPPGIIFFDGQGREIPGVRVIGFKDAQKFGEILTQVKRF